MKIITALFFALTLGSTPSQGESLKVLTFNTWLLELLDLKIASDLSERRLRLAEALEGSDADVVNLVEVWQPKNADFLVKRLRNKYPFCSYNPDRVRFGALYSNGLLVLSKFPLKNGGHVYPSGCVRPVDALVFQETTRIDEQFVSKGAIHNVVYHPSLGSLDLYSSHLGALTFDESSNDYVSRHKEKVLKQAEALTRFIDQTREAETQILAVDTNRHFREWHAQEGESQTLDPTYLEFLKHGLHDTYMESNALDPETLTGLYTFDLRENSYASEGHFKKAPSEFIDYVFVRGGELHALSSALQFNRGRPLSDHFAIETTFEGSPLVRPLADL